MNGQLLAYFYVFAHISVGSIALIIAWLVVRIRREGARTFSLMLLFQTLWALAYALEALVEPFPLKILCHQISWIGILGSMVTWFLFVLKFTHVCPKIPFWLYASVWMVPIASLALIFTNPWHHLYWREILPAEPGYTAGLTYLRGSLYLLPTLYAQFVTALSAIFLFRSIFRTARAYRWQNWLLLVAMLLPGVVSTLHFVRILPLDLAPIAFAVFGATMGWIIFLSPAFEIMPVSLDVLFNSISYGVLVVDMDNRIVDLNPAVTKLTGISRKAIGASLAQVLKKWTALRSACESLTEGTTWVVEERKPRLYLEVKIVPLYNNYKELYGRMILLSDISSYKKTEEALLESEAKMRLMFENVSEGISYYRQFRDGRRVLLECNRRYVEMSGLTRAALFELDDISKMQTSMDSAEVREKLKQAQRSGQPYTGVFSWNRPDGKDNLIEYTAVTISLGDDLYTIGVDMDVTERRAAERALQDSEQRLRTLFELNPDGIFLTDTATTTIVDCNHAAARMVNYTREELIGQPSALINTPETNRKLHETASLRNLRAEILARGELTMIAARLRKDGSQFPVESSIALIHYGGRELFLGIDRDITERVRSQQAEREQRTLAEALRDSAAALTSTLDLNEVLDRILEQVNRVLPGDSIGILMLEGSLARIVRWRATNHVQQDEVKVYEINFQVDETPTLRTLLTTRQPLIISDTRGNPDWVYRPEVDWIRSYVGAPILVRDEVIGFINVDSATPGFFQPKHAECLMTFANQAAIAIQNARLYSQAQRLAITDPLTGLFNRGHLMLLAQTELERAIQAEEPLGVILLDIDHFKDVNDTFGHPVGDEVLRALARIFRESVHTLDAVGRYGGEEFMVILPNSSPEQTRHTAERLRRQIEVLEVQAGEQPVHVTASLGVANLGHPPEPSLDHLIQRADQALYRAKQNGRNRVSD